MTWADGGWLAGCPQVKRTLPTFPAPTCLPLSYATGPHGTLFADFAVDLLKSWEPGYGTNGRRADGWAAGHDRAAATGNAAAIHRCRRARPDSSRRVVRRRRLRVEDEHHARPAGRGEAAGAALNHAAAQATGGAAARPVHRRTGQGP